LDKVISMVEHDDYCIDVLHQSQAVQSALKQTDGVILKSHLENCVVNNIKKGETEKTIEEIMKVFEKGNK
jgi:DNA-binding FrmR family transcriptional regulator